MFRKPELENHKSWLFYLKLFWLLGCTGMNLMPYFTHPLHFTGNWKALRDVPLQEIRLHKFLAMIKKYISKFLFFFLFFFPPMLGNLSECTGLKTFGGWYIWLKEFNSSCDMPPPFTQFYCHTTYRKCCVMGPPPDNNLPRIEWFENFGMGTTYGI